MFEERKERTMGGVQLREDVSLVREMGFWQVWAVGVGSVVGDGIFLYLGQGIQQGGPSALVGFAFAGSVTAALCIYTNASHMLSHLASIEKNIPSIEDINKFLVTIAQSYTLPISNPFPMEFSVFGWCPIKKENKVFYTSIDSKNHVTREDKSEECKEQPLIMGCHKQEIFQKINDAISMENCKTRIPLMVLKKIVLEHEFNEIGGAVQLGININSPKFEFSKLTVI